MSRFRQVFLSHFSKPTLCFAIFFLFLSTQYATQSFSNNLIPEKSIESEKEEEKTEEERSDSQESGYSWIQKVKKVKKILSEPYISSDKIVTQNSFGSKFFYLPPPLFFSYKFPYIFTTISRYVVFCSLVFYEI